MDKISLNERDICTKFITPAILDAGWQQNQFRQEVNLTDGRVIVRGTLATRSRNPEVKGGPKRADYVLYAKQHLPIAVIEAKQARFAVGQGMQQALLYAEMLDAPFALSSNGESFLLHDRTGITKPVERPLPLNAFPKLDELWPIYEQWKGLADPQAMMRLVEQPYYSDGTGREPRYYQSVAITVSFLMGISMGNEEEASVRVPRIEIIAPLVLDSTPSPQTEAPLASLLARNNGAMAASELWHLYGGEIDSFYAQLKTEVAQGWICEPCLSEVRERLPEPNEG